MLTARKQSGSWFWILFASNNGRGFHIDVAPEKGQEYQTIRIIGKDAIRRHKSVMNPKPDKLTWSVTTGKRIASDSSSSLWLPETSYLLAPLTFLPWLSYGPGMRTIALPTLLELFQNRTLYTSKS